MWMVSIDAEIPNDGPAFLRTELAHITTALQGTVSAGGDRSVSVAFRVEAADGEAAVRVGRARFVAAARDDVEIVSVSFEPL